MYSLKIEPSPDIFNTFDSQTTKGLTRKKNEKSQRK